MKAIFTQGHGFYGFNLRLITDEEAQRLLKEHDIEGQTGHWVEEPEMSDSFTVEIVDVPVGFQMGVGGSVGFDSGLWKEHETFLDMLLYPTR